MSSEAAQRLAAAVKARRDELDLTQHEVWKNNGGPSNTTLTIIENGLLENLTRTTRRKLDAGLKWVPGSALNVWDGTGAPEPLPQPSALSEDDLVEAVETAGFNAEQRDHILRLIAEDAERHRAERGRKRGVS